MSKTYLPQTVVPGAQKVTNDEGGQLYDRRGRPVWSMPIPQTLTRHFRSAGSRRKYEAGEIDYDTATKTVPSYRGFSASLVRVMRATLKYRQRQQLRDAARAAALQLETGIVTETIQ